jgi:hypothetical protein
MVADMLKNPCKATGFDSNSHKCATKGGSILQEGWLATLEVFAVSLAGLFQHICHPYTKLLLQC